MNGNASGIWRRAYPSNPSYLVSAMLVLYGLHLAFGGGESVAGGSLLTSLFCGYTLALAVVGVVVIRLCGLWEDARTVLLVLLLMFAALSTAFDRLCLSDFEAGALNLGVGFLFCVFVAELVLWGLVLKLPVAYRFPFYAQLGLLFGFPPLLGWYSLEGRSLEMCQGVAGFALASGLAVLGLIPAALRSRETLQPAGSAWVWPFYPWSLFVFLAVALAVRTWMLCVSFSPVKGLDSAFLPYLLIPLVIAVSSVLLAAGLRHGSIASQRLALLMLGAAPLLAVPFQEPSQAQEFLLSVVSELVGGPLYAGTVAVCVVSFAGVLFRASWAEPVAVFGLVLLLSLEPTAISFREALPFSGASMAVIVLWLVVRGVVSRSFLQLGLGVVGLIALAGPQLPSYAAFSVTQLQQASVVMLWLLTAPLLCRDRFSRFVRMAAPVWIPVASFVSLVVMPSIWPPLHGWTPPAASAGITLLGLVYLAVTKNRWCLLSSVLVAVACAGSLVLWLLHGLDGYQFRNGMRAYAAGCTLLLIGLLVSLIKSGYAWRLYEWLDTNHAPSAAKLGSGQEPAK